jgi:hypothetical protein
MQYEGGQSQKRELELSGQRSALGRHTVKKGTCRVDNIFIFYGPEGNFTFDVKNKISTT